MLSVLGSDKLRAAVLGLKQARREIRNDINRATRQEMNPVWRDEVAEAASTGMDRAVIVKGARIAAGNPPAAIAATSSRKLSGGLVPVEDWPAWEFGGDQGRVTTYQRRSKNGGTHTVKRHTARQIPARAPKGRVAYAALEQLAPRLASLWVSIIVRKFNEAVEKGE